LTRFFVHSTLPTHPQTPAVHMAYSQVELNSRGYPLNPEAELCRHYWSTLKCDFGIHCWKAHPEVWFNSRGYRLNSGAEVCSHYQKTGSCDFENCFKDHPEGMGPSGWNSAGYPLWRNREDCPFFLKGLCKHGATCSYNHPQAWCRGIVVTAPKAAPASPFSSSTDAASSSSQSLSPPRLQPKSAATTAAPVRPQTQQTPSARPMKAPPAALLNPPAPPPPLFPGSSSEVAASNSEHPTSWASVGRSSKAPPPPPPLTPQRQPQQQELSSASKAKASTCSTSTSTAAATTAAAAAVAAEQAAAAAAAPAAAAATASATPPLPLDWRVVATELLEQQGLVVLVDATNIAVEGQKAMGFEEYGHEVQDVRWRVDWKQLFRMLEDGEQTALRVAFGIYNKGHKALEALPEGVIKDLSSPAFADAMGGGGGKELSNKLTQLLCLDAGRSPCRSENFRRKYVVVGGSRNYLPAIQLCLESSPRAEVELWSWQRSTHRCYYKLAEEHNRFTFHLLDDHMNQQSGLVCIGFLQGLPQRARERYMREHQDRTFFFRALEGEEPGQAQLWTGKFSKKLPLPHVVTPLHFESGKHAAVTCTLELSSEQVDMLFRKAREMVATKLGEAKASQIVVNSGTFRAVPGASAVLGGSGSNTINQSAAASAAPAVGATTASQPMTRTAATTTSVGGSRFSLLQDEDSSSDEEETDETDDNEKEESQDQDPIQNDDDDDIDTASSPPQPAPLDSAVSWEMAGQAELQRQSRREEKRDKRRLCHETKLCLLREFCWHPHCCYAHTERERRFFGNKPGSPLIVQKLKPCENTSPGHNPKCPDSRCPYLHEGEAKLCLNCAQVPCQNPTQCQIPGYFVKRPLVDFGTTMFENLRNRSYLGAGRRVRK